MFPRNISTWSISRSLSARLCSTKKTDSSETFKEEKGELRPGVENSIKYLKSSGYRETYGDSLVWELYRRPKTSHYLGETRKTCIRGSKISGNPCPICRDKYLILHYLNVALLKQFISEFSGEILPSKKTGLCQKQHQKLEIAVRIAKNYGLLSFHVPFRHYDYEYYEKLAENTVVEKCEHHTV